MTTEAIVAGIDSVARLTKVELPPMSPTRVRVRTRISGISCGTESDATSGRATYMTRPFLGGYQAVGTVVEVGDQVQKLKPGDTVFTTGGGLWGMTHLYGGSHARESVSEASGVIPLQPDLKALATASYTHLAAVGYEGIARMKLMPGSILVISGLGMLGQLAGRIGQQLGLRVIGVNRSAWKRDAALAIGFDAVCPPEMDAIQATIERLGFGPAKYVYETTGHPQMTQLMLNVLGPDGELSIGGYWPDPPPLDEALCRGKNLSVCRPVGGGERLSAVVDLIHQGRLNVESLIRTRVTPEQITKFYADLIRNHTKYLGAVIDWPN